MELISEFPFMGTISRSTENPLGDDIQSTVYSGKMDLKVLNAVEHPSPTVFD